MKHTSLKLASLLAAAAVLSIASCRNTAHGVVNDTQRNTRKVGNGVERVGHKIGEGVETTGEKIQDSTR
jgi:predicted small secreted protein